MDPDLTYLEQQLIHLVARRLMEIADVPETADVLTLRWTPIGEHHLWVRWASEVIRIVRLVRDHEIGAILRDEKLLRQENRQR